MAIKTKGSVTLGGSNGDSSVPWEDAPTTFTRRCAFVRIYGDTGTGRTSLALTAPGPLALLHTAEKIDGVVQKFARDKKIRMLNFGGTFRGSTDEIQSVAGRKWLSAESAWYDAIDKWARTAILDTDTEAWELIRLAYFGELNPKGRTDSLYGPVNARWRSLFKHFREQGRCSIISIGQTKDEYRDVKRDGKVSSERTGRTVAVGMKEMGYMADVVLRCGRSADGGFNVVIEKGWWNAHIEGMQFEDDDCRLPYILSLITETDESEWE